MLVNCEILSMIIYLNLRCIIYEISLWFWIYYYYLWINLFFIKAFYVLSKYASSFPCLLVSISMYILFSWLIYLALLDSHVVISLLLDFGWNTYCVYYDIYCLWTNSFVLWQHLTMLLRYAPFFVYKILWVGMGYTPKLFNWRLNFDASKKFTLVFSNFSLWFQLWT